MNKPYFIPVSIKGIVFENGKVWLRQNERTEWELPGGKIDPGEHPEQTVKREVYEELGFEVEPIDIIQAHLHTIKSSPDEANGVFVVAYLCKIIKKSGDFENTGYHHFAKFQAFPLEELEKLHMPQFYKDAILKASKRI